jgi:hypothetical protein
MAEPLAVTSSPPALSWYEQAPRFVTALALGVVLAAVATSRPAPLGVLDGILFSYYNNSADPGALFYFNGWIALVPEIVAYLARGLSVPGQMAVYLAVATASALIMQRELQKLLQLWLRLFEAAMLSFVMLVFFQFYLPRLNQLVWCIWPLAIAAFCHILRKNFSGTAFSWTGLAAATLGCLTNPTAVVLIPLLGYFSLATRDAALRRQDAALAMLLLVYFAAIAFLKPAEVNYLPGNVVIGAARAMWHQLQAPLWWTIPLAIPILALAAICTAAFLRKIGDDTARKVILTLAYVGFSSIALFLLSGRVEIEAKLPPRYTILCTTMALVAFTVYAAGSFNARQRQWMICLVAAGVASAQIFLLASRLPAHLHQIREQFAFARAVDDFRASCQPGEAITQRPKPPGTVILCNHITTAATAALPVAHRDAFGNVFVAGPPAKLWRTTATAPTELLAPQR